MLSSLVRMISPSSLFKSPEDLQIRSIRNRNHALIGAAKSQRNDAKRCDDSESGDWHHQHQSFGLG